MVLLQKNVIDEQRVNDNNYKELKKLFPQAVSVDENGKYVIDPQKLQMSLDPSLAEIKEDGYGLNWVGKKEAYHRAFTKNQKVLKPLKEQSKNWDATGNLLIKGDNLDALKILRHNYFEAVKMIYIDPPYNTKNDSFVYNDNFTATTEETLEELGYEKEYIDYIENIQGAKTHSGWLSFMYPRLLLAKDLLKEDGVIFISIDDNEVAQLRLLCDEVFGEENFVSQFIWSGGRKNDSKLVSVSHEYVLCYVKSLEYLKEKQIIWRQKKKGLDEIYKIHNKLKKDYKNDYSKMTIKLKEWYRNLPSSHPSKAHKHYSVIDKNGIYFPSDISWPGGGGPKYEVLHPITNKPVKIPSRGWVFSKVEKFKDMMERNLVHFADDETFVPCLKSYLIDKEYQVPYSVFYQDGRSSMKRLRELMTEDVFQHPKDENILKDFIELGNTKDEIILDFFAGSGTTAHAVMDLNAKDNGNRKFICVQWAEETPEKSEARKAGYETIFDITKERIDRAGEQIAQGDIGFRTFEVVDDVKQKLYQKPLDQVRQEDLLSFSQTPSIETHEEILYNLLVAESLSLSSKITERIAEKLYSVENVLFVLGAIDMDELIEQVKALERVEYITVYSPLVDDDKFTLELESAVEHVGIKGDKLRFRG